jgi:two-component system sensor histidine kinase AgrC
MLQNNIKFEFYNSINYKTLPIPSYEFSKILGILLDNAIDASLLSKEKEISLICRCKNNNYSIILKNSYINKDVNTEKIYQKGFSTKKIKSGLGLWEVSKILGNFLQISLITQKDNNYFTQSLQITSKSTSKHKKMLINSII